MLCVLLTYMSLSTIQNIECCKTMLLWQIFVADNNKIDVLLHVKFLILH